MRSSRRRSPKKMVGNMADVQQDEIVTTDAAGGGKKRILLMAGALVGVMLLEGVGVFLLARQFAGGPASAEAAEVGLDPAEGTKTPVDVELEVVKLRAQNEKSQQMIVYDLTVAISVPETVQEQVSETVGRKKATIQDRLGRVVRALEPQRFSEPDLATLRDRFRHELSQILGPDCEIKEVLIPSIVKYNE